eukprot:14393447-Ditylum_brightwellii.AAC.1
MRWFHVAPKDIGSGKKSATSSNRGGADANTSSSGLSSTMTAGYKESNLGGRSSSSRRVKKDTVFFPMNLHVTHRTFRRFDSGENP